MPPGEKDGEERGNQQRPFVRAGDQQAAQQEEEANNGTDIDIACREWLLAQVPRICEFLADELGLQLHMGKLHVRDVRHGVEFLGAFVKPYRDYISNKTSR